jgi:hypothetical protein
VTPLGSKFGSLEVPGIKYGIFILPETATEMNEPVGFGVSCCIKKTAKPPTAEIIQTLSQEWQ